VDHASGRSDDIRIIGRPRTSNPKKIDKLHVLDHGELPREPKPSPVSHDGTNIEVDTWFTESRERNMAKCKKDGWLVSQMFDDENQHTPSGPCFNAAISSADPPITVPGMLPRHQQMTTTSGQQL